MSDTVTQAPAPTDSPKDAGDESSTLLQELFTAAKTIGHPEIWGVTLSDPATHIPSQIIFQKYLNANDGDVTKAKDQLMKTLKWRAEMKPLGLIAHVFPKGKFDGLGYVTTYTSSDTAAGPEDKEVFTWNVYGIVKNMEETFGDKDLFIKWRVALMELALQELSLSTATEPITAIHDPYKMYQVHDYKSVSFFRQNPSVKAASTETIRVFSQNYPELLKEKFFVNVPGVMGWMYSIIKLIVAPKTAKKFHPMTNSINLANEFADSEIEKLGEKLPNEYGGSTGELTAVGKQTALE